MPRVVVALVIAVCLVAAPSAQDGQARGVPKSYEDILDVFVRDGFVYYRALKAERSKLDAYVASLAATAVDKLARDEQFAFWLNAYNALVLRTVIDHYPIPQRSADYPPHSIRQIPGAFERLPHRVAGKNLTLDQIEKAILTTFADPRAFLAIGRGAVGGGRLRSEPFLTARLGAQLKEVAEECVSRPECIQIDKVSKTLNVNAIFSWREEEFVEVYANTAPAAFVNRSPIERAVLAFIQPRLLTTEREILANNDFKMAFKPFDWSLNDLTGRGGR